MKLILIPILLLIGQNFILCDSFMYQSYLNQILGFDIFGMDSYPSLSLPSLYMTFSKVACAFKECCPDNWAEPNLKDLSKSLQESLYGQQLVKNIVLTSLRSRYMTDNPDKALVLSFHGWTGSGKNYVAKHIVNSLFATGLKSQFVHLFISSLHFPHEDKVDIYKLHIQDWIRGNVSRCEQSVFIFDEIDKMPIGVINAIKPFIDHHESIDGVNYRKSIFIFLSNTGSYYINQKVVDLWRDGIDISTIKYEDLESLIQKGAFNEIGGLHSSDVISHNLVDYYIPFLPLQKKHVELCIRDEVLRRNREPKEDLIKKIADSLTYFPPGTSLLSTTGCKKVSQKTAYYLAEDSIAHDFL